MGVSFWLRVSRFFSLLGRRCLDGRWSDFGFSSFCCGFLVVLVANPFTALAVGSLKGSHGVFFFVSVGLDVK